MCFPWALARLLPSAVRVRIRSRSTSGRPPRTASIKRPVLVPVSAHGSARNCALASTMRLTMPNRSKVLRASRSMRVAVATSPGASLAEHPVKLAPVGSRARHFLAVNIPTAASRRPELAKLGVKRLALGADAHSR